MASISISAPGASGFLYNSGHNTARLCVTAETPDFDTSLIRRWQDEGLDVQYVPFNGGGKDYVLRLKSVKEGLGVGENYAIVAFGDAASFCLDYYIKPTTSSRLCTLIAYYPTNIPDPRMHFPPTLRVMTHLAGSTVDVTTTPTMLGLQGKRRTTTRQINPGIGTGERLNIGHLAYTYEHAQPGFAETDLEEYDRLASELAWSRTLQMLRKGFGKDPDIEHKWEEHLEAKFFSMNLSDTMAPYTNQVTPTVTYTPTVSGGIGTHALRRFYEHHFLQKLPPSMRLRLISRTQGTDRVVDEVFMTFEHTHEIPWMLPGVPPTQKRVEIVMVSIVSLRGGKLYSEHVYWDQASVLVQLGILDPKLVPQSAPPSVDRLPVVGREAARRMLQEDPEVDGKDFHNRLIRRARAKAKGKDGEPQTPAVEESGAEGKSELDTPLKDSKGKGKAVQQESRQAGPQLEAGADDEEAGEEGGEEGQNGDGQNGDGQNGHSNGKKGTASVEDASGEDE